MEHKYEIKYSEGTDVSKQYFTLNIVIDDKVYGSYSGYLDDEIRFLIKWVCDNLENVYKLGFKHGNNNGWHEGYEDAKEDYNVDG